MMLLYYIDYDEGRPHSGLHVDRRGEREADDILPMQADASAVSARLRSEQFLG